MRMALCHGRCVLVEDPVISTDQRTQEVEREDRDAQILHALVELNHTMERLCTALGLPQVYSRRKMLWRSMLSGMARGLGYAIGFTILGALLISMLTFLARQNLPVIGAFIARIVQLVQAYMP